jgi:REP element-mobilizing transposase RayT
VIRRLKSITTNYLWRNEQEHLRYFYWKNKNILWTNGYFVETVGNVSENKISEYIKNQGK